MSEVRTHVAAGVGFISLDRARALNALSLPMVRALAAALQAWRDDPAIDAVAIRGHSRDPHRPGASQPFGAFCAGGDIRFFHQAALAGDPQLEDFFTEEYALNHLIHHYPKPYIAFLDGIVMGGGMGIASHRSHRAVRIVTERSRLAMPETNIGLFPDVGGGWFLSRCPGRVGEYLALTGHAIGAADALALALADRYLPADALPALWARLETEGVAALNAPVGPPNAPDSIAAGADVERARGQIDHFFGLATVPQIVTALEADASPWAQVTAAVLRTRSPLMLHVVLEQLRRGRTMSLADDLRMERGVVRRCFHLRPGAASETVEGIRALAVDKDQAPRWNPARIEDVSADAVAAFFDSPWPADAHPLRHLA